MNIFDAQNECEQILQLNHVALVLNQRQSFFGILVMGDIPHLFQNLATLLKVYFLRWHFTFVKIDIQILQSRQKPIFNFGCQNLILPENIDF